MTSPAHDHTDHTSTSTSPGPVRACTAARVEAALSTLDGVFLALGPLPRTDEGWAAYSTTMAWICARRAGWWRVLLVDHRRTAALRPVHERAAQIAHHKAREDFRFWRETAADWQARGEQRPTSDAAGGLSNWTELGVTP